MFIWFVGRAAFWSHWGFTVAVQQMMAATEGRHLGERIQIAVAATGNRRGAWFPARSTTWRCTRRDRCRVAVVTLLLGDMSLASDMCQLRPDPIQRTIFIDKVATLQGDAKRLARFATSMVDPAFRSGICLGIGGVPDEQLTVEAKETWEPIFADWYRHDPDKGAHSAAGWALSRLHRKLPDIALSPQPEGERQWHVNKAGMTMLKMSAGTFIRKDLENRYANIINPIDQKITLPRPFLLSDREVSVGLFQRLIDDRDYPGNEKADGDGSPADFSPTADHPAQRVEWNHAVLLCNWLSRKERLEPCYLRTGESWDLPSHGPREKWRLIPGADGYRLPTEAEWEYACRAGTVAQSYTFGNDELTAYPYAVFGTIRTKVCGSKLPNGWGFFDLHGNVMEWCQDWHGPYGSALHMTYPTGPGGEKMLQRVVRGWARRTRSLCVGSSS